MKKIICLFTFFLLLNFSVFGQWNVLGSTNAISALFADTLSIRFSALYSDNKTGNIYAGYSAYSNHGYNTSSVLKWDGLSWQNFLSPVQSPSHIATDGGVHWGDVNILSIVSTPNTHQLFAAGSLYNSSGIGYVAKWNGSGWNELGGQNALGIVGDNRISLCVDSTENLYAACGANFAKWNGSQWTQLNTSALGVPIFTCTDPGGTTHNCSTNINGICSDGQGNIYAVGNFTNAAGKTYVAKWDGTTWTELSGLYTSFNTMNNYPYDYDSPNLITSDRHGNIYVAGGKLRNAQGRNYVGKWDGTTWSELAGANELKGGVSSMAIDNYGNIFVLNNVASTPIISKWNNNNWIDLPNYFSANQIVAPSAICIDTLGSLYATTNICTPTQSSCYFYNNYVAKYDKAYLVGVEELGSENVAIKIYPNPAKESINVEFNNVNKYLELKLTDISGRVIKQMQLTERNQIDVSDLSNGIYFFSVYQNNQHIKTEKIIKE